jgi:pimeloyl-ACP methyl ester carboxylesterase
MILLPDREGAMAGLDLGPQDRAVDAIFVHANGFNARTYRTTLEPPSSRWRILAPDLRGHGASTLPSADSDWPGWQGFAADLRSFIQATARRPVVLAGHSLGATASLLAALEIPELIREVILFEPVLYDAAMRSQPLWDAPLAAGALRRRERFSDPEAAVTAFRGRGGFANWSDDQLRDYVAGAFQATPEGDVRLVCRPRWEAATYAIHDYDPRVMAKLPCPLRIVAAERESTFGAEARALAAALGLHVELVCGATHFLPMERPDIVRRTLEASLSSQAGS